MKLHEYLTNLMEKNGLSIKDLADLSAIPYTTVRRVVSGETANPNIETVKSLVLSVGGDLRVLPKLGLMDEAGELVHEIVETSPPAIMECPQITISADLLMSYRSSMLRNYRHIRFLRLTLLIACIALFVLMAAVIVMFIYDYAHMDRGWIRSMFFGRSVRI